MKNGMKEVYIVDGARTPFLKARGIPGPFSASDLALYAARNTLERCQIAPDSLGEVVTGCVMPREYEANISRIVSLRLGCGNHVPAWTVQRNCASGMQALDSAIKDIGTGRHDLVLAGGTEAMSHAPILFNEQMVSWLGGWARAKTLPQKLQLLPKFRFRYLIPVIALLKGLSDPIVGENMGQTAENLAFEFGITRNEMDAFALASHQKLGKAMDKSLMNELATVYDNAARVHASDDGLRRDSSMEKLKKLKPFFDKKFGMVTAGNSSQVTDGAAYLLLASKEAVKEHQLKPLGRVIDVNWAGLDPRVMGLGPVFASVPLMQKHKLSMSDVDYWEINEAFAAQVIACQRAFADDAFCEKHFGMKKAIGVLPDEKLNVDGGAVAIGHPVGASGARIVLHLLHVLKERKAKRGMAAICIGGGQGGAMLIESLAGA